MKNTLLALVFVISSSAVAGPIRVDNAYVRHAPPGQTVSGAFMILNNSGDADRAAISAESNVAETVELHTHVHDDGVMRMRQVEKIDIPAGGSTALKPGGFHVMLIGVKKPLELGQMVEIKLNFDDGSSEQIEAEVKSVMAGMNMQGGMKQDKKKMKHGDMPKMDQSKMKNMSN